MAEIKEIKKCASLPSSIDVVGCFIIGLLCLLIVGLLPGIFGALDLYTDEDGEPVLPVIGGITAWVLVSTFFIIYQFDRRAWSKLW